MSYSSHQLSGEPILLVTLYADFDLATEAAGIEAERIALLEAAQEPLHVILDVSQVELSLDDIIKASNMLVRGASLAPSSEQNGYSLFSHANLRQFIVVSNNRMVHMAAKGMNHPVFGSQNVAAFTSVEEALAHCRR
jgi:hypothetical protein